MSQPAGGGGQYRYQQPTEQLSSYNRGHQNDQYSQGQQYANAQYQGGYQQTNGHVPAPNHRPSQQNNYQLPSQNGSYQSASSNGYPPPVKNPQQIPSKPRPPQQSRSSRRRPLPSSLPSPPAVKKNKRIDDKAVPRPEVRQSELTGGDVPRYKTASRRTPPPAASQFVSIDDGNASPRFVRWTINSIPRDQTLADKSSLAVAAVIQPLAAPGFEEDSVPVVEMPNGEGPIRCSACRAYINPWCKFIGGGAKWRCNLCSCENDVPAWYHCNLDQNGTRRDRNDRPELSRGSVEYVAPESYCLGHNPLSDPIFFFMVDVSPVAVSSGLLASSVDAINRALDEMADQARTQVGFLTYHSTVHFYQLSTGRMHIMAELDSPFLPLPASELLAKMDDIERVEKLRTMLNELTNLHTEVQVKAESYAFGAAVMAAYDALSPTGGKLCIIQSQLPSLGVGRLKNRDEVARYGTPGELDLFRPQDSFYQIMGTKCAEKCIGVDLFIGSKGFVDVATVGELVRTTGGQMFYYSNFDKNKDGDALATDITHVAVREQGFGSQLVVRASQGLEVGEYYGNFFKRDETEIELPIIDADKTLAVRLNHTGTVPDDGAAIQVAMIYTNMDGRRMIRVHTSSVASAKKIANVFRSVDLDTVMNVSLKQIAQELTCVGNESLPYDTRRQLTAACVEILYVYRKYCSPKSSAGQLVLPESLKLLPLYTLGVLKHQMLSDRIPVDERLCLLNYANTMPCDVSHCFIVPKFFRLDSMPDNVCCESKSGRVLHPECLANKLENIKSDGLYLLDVGNRLYLQHSEDLPDEIWHQIFSVGDDNAVVVRVPDEDDIENNSLGYRLDMLIGDLRFRRPSHLALSIINRNFTKLKGLSVEQQQFLDYMVEDPVRRPGERQQKKPPIEKMSYIDYLCHIHRQIQDKILGS